MQPPIVLLVFGATGSTGRRVLEHALARGLAVHAFVRNAARLPEALRPRLAGVVVGDLNDSAAVAAAVRSVRPDVIVDASSALPIGTPPGAPKNNADRTVIFRTTLAALEAEGRLGACRLLIVGGQILAEPGGDIIGCFPWTISFLLGLLIPRQWAAVKRTIAALWATPGEFDFTMLRMGYMKELPSRGALRPALAKGNWQRGEVAFDDVGRALVELAVDRSGAFKRQAVFLNY